MLKHPEKNKSLRNKIVLKNEIKAEKAKKIKKS